MLDGDACITMGNQQFPVTFNLLKHHAGSIRTFISQSDVTSFSLLKSIGGSQMDLYYGQLSPDSIMEEIILFLRQNDLLEEEKYSLWLSAHSGYRTVTLSDASHWVLRKGNNEGSYIHIHPARYSPHTLRVTANVLKTVIACGVAMKQHIMDEVNLQSMNHVRKTMLHLSPMKKLSVDSLMTRVMEMLLPVLDIRHQS